MIRFGIRLPAPGPFYAFIPLNRRRGRRITRQMIADQRAMEARERARAAAAIKARADYRYAETGHLIERATADMARLPPGHMKHAYLARQIEILEAERAQIVR